VALTLLLAAGGFGAGAFGALLGLGGGVLIVPLLALGLGLPLREAVGISLLAVIATSSAGAATYLRRGVANLRLGLTLEVVTVLGAIVGGLVAFAVDERLIAALFGVMLVYVAITMVRRRAPSAGGDPEPAVIEPDPAAEEALQAPAPAPVPGGTARLAASVSRPEYHVRNVPAGLALGGLAGVISALLGVGGGIVLVPAMHLAMGMPLRAATATSNLVIGVTASASAALYVLRGTIDPLVAAPILVGTFLGAAAAARLAHRVPVGLLRWVFVAVLLYVAFQMLVRAFGQGAVA
jgi:uncharacterized membrane protein YfcA